MNFFMKMASSSNAEDDIARVPIASSGITTPLGGLGGGGGSSILGGVVSGGGGGSSIDPSSWAQRRFPYYGPGLYLLDSYGNLKHVDESSLVSREDFEKLERERARDASRLAVVDKQASTIDALFDFIEENDLLAEALARLRELGISPTSE